MNRDEKIMKLTLKYLKTFPPITKNGNNSWYEFKRMILTRRIVKLVGGDRTKYEEILKRTKREYGLN